MMMTMLNRDSIASHVVYPVFSQLTELAGFTTMLYPCHGNSINPRSPSWSLIGNANTLPKCSLFMHSNVQMFSYGFNS